MCVVFASELPGQQFPVWRRLIPRQRLSCCQVNWGEPWIADRLNEPDNEDVSQQKHWHSESNLFCLISLHSMEQIWGRWSNLFRSKTTFTLQMKIVRIMVAAKPRHSYRSLFERPEILPTPRDGKFSLWIFMVHNQANLHTNSEIHNINIWIIFKTNCQSFAFSENYAGIDIFHGLPWTHKSDEQKDSS